ncbi:MAG TPA: MFS transporter [Bacilli bacterium]|nr:MFS transporter [Bacilli bacterium]
MKILRFHPVAWAVILGTFASRTGFYMTIPFLAMYLQQKGLEPTTIGAVLSLSFFVGTAASFLSGAWSDRIGRYPVMFLSMATWSLVFVGFAVAEQMWLFFLLSALNGMCRYVFEPVARALLSDVTPEEQQANVFSARYLAINVGAAIGPLAGMYFGTHNSTMPFWLTAGAYAVYALAILVLMGVYPVRPTAAENERVTFRETVKVVLTDRAFGLFLLANVFITAAYSHLETTLSLYMGSDTFADGVRLFSQLLVANAVLVVLLQIPLVKWAKRFRNNTALVIGSICFALSLLGLGLFHSLVPLVISMAFFSAGEVLVFILADVAINGMAPEHLRGAYFGASGFQFLGQSVGPLLGGWLLALWGYHQGGLVFGVLAVVTLLAVPLFRSSEKALHRKKEIPTGGELRHNGSI